AERAGLSAKAVAALERGDRTTPRLTTVGQLATALDVEPHVRTELLRAASVGTPRAAAARQVEPRLKLPLPPLPLIGREAEVAKGAALLEPTTSATRLLTLVGPGGVGKTRLALEIAARVGSRYRDGAVFVELAPVRDVRLVSGTIA